MDPTVTDTHNVSPPLPEAPQPLLSVVGHLDPRYIGMERILEDSLSLELGRGGGALGPGVLDDGRISRRHARLTRRGDRVRLDDLGSHNGTWVNGVQITGSVELVWGDVIEMGRLMMLFDTALLDVPLPHNPRVIGASRALGAILQQIARLAPLPEPVLILGERGVGKELIAREIHHQSRRTGAFIAVNCAGLTDSLIQSELFGHAQGAFTGASHKRAGLIAAAMGGTLLLDEIGDASAVLQGSLLRLLQEREYRPLGGDQSRRADVRVLAATNRDMEDESRIRPDLLARLRHWTIQIPPLRARPADILPLARHFAALRNEPSINFERRLQVALLRHRWPDNIRELEGLIGRMMVERDDPQILNLPDWWAPALHTAEPAQPRTQTRPAPEALTKLLADHHGDVPALAEALGVGRSTLYRWLKAAALKPEDFRPPPDATPA
ncbi:MAG: sigma 54-interacting transcriptional regulator [Myxococcota bacterium]